MPRETDFEQNLCADMQGFSLHAAVRCGTDERQALEQPCLYITRPALANERVQTNAGWQVVRKLEALFRDGATHLVKSPLEFMQRLPALLPRARLHLIRFGVRITAPREVSGPPLREHGVLAPSAKLRAMVVLQEVSGLSSRCRC
jgi:Putative transposase